MSLKTGWWCFELPGYRPHAEIATYSLFSYEDLPPIDAPTDPSFTWLRTQPAYEHSLADGCYTDGTAPDLVKPWSTLLTQLTHDLPASFTTFIQTPELHQRICSCTECYLELPDFIVPTSYPKNGILIHFLSDQQWILHWYLYVDPLDNNWVFVSPKAFGFQWFDFTEEGNAADNQLSAAINLHDEPIWLCAPTFTDFIYRYWLENELWFTLIRKKLTLTPVQQAYVEHYGSSALITP